MKIEESNNRNYRDSGGVNLLLNPILEMNMREQEYPESFN